MKPWTRHSPGVGFAVGNGAVLDRHEVVVRQVAVLLAEHETLGQLAAEQGAVEHTLGPVVDAALVGLAPQPDLNAATGFLKGWIATAMNSKLKPLFKAAKTIRNCSKGILRWHYTRMTNVVMEGLNSLLQAAKRKARGYRLHSTFITMAYLIAGKLELKAASPFACQRLTH